MTVSFSSIDEEQVPALKIDVCFQVLLRAGAKSISHTFKALDKYVLHVLCTFN